MKRLWTNYLAWRNRNEQRRLKRWEKTRTKGAARYIALTALLWAGLMVAYSLILDFYYHRKWSREKLYITLVVDLIAGVVFAVIMWIVSESQYKNTSQKNGSLNV